MSDKAISVPDTLDYLVSYGRAGEMGRFRATQSLNCLRGDRVVVRTERGLAIGSILCTATSQHAHLLENGVVGELLRPVSAQDEEIANGIQARAGQLIDDARDLANDVQLPLEILDVEISLDGHHVTLYHLRWAECDERPLVSALSKKYEVMVALRDLALPEGATACGRPDCGNHGSGCTTCSSGGCSTGCGSKKLGKELQEYFLSLRQKMEERPRVPLL